jgi:hypothetical protein
MNLQIVATSMLLSRAICPRLLPLAVIAARNWSVSLAGFLAIGSIVSRY